MEDLSQSRICGWLEDYAFFNVSEEEFIAKVKSRALCTFAVLKNGQWYEKGQMGWWGLVSNEKEEQKWNEEWYRLVMSLPEDTLLTIVDCHI